MNRQLFPLTLPRAARRFLLCLLIAALAVYGCSSALVQLMGPVHVHAEPASSFQTTGGGVRPTLRALPGVAWLQQKLHPLRDLVHDQAHEPGVQSAHQHNHFERHHHQQGDPAVIALGAEVASGDAAADLTPASGGSTSLPLGLACGLRLPFSPQADARPPAVSPAFWRNVVPRRMERPPRNAASKFSVPRHPVLA